MSPRVAYARTTTGVTTALLVTEAVLRTALHATDWYDALLWHRYVAGLPFSFDDFDRADGIGALVWLAHLPTMVAACVAVAVWQWRHRRGARARLSWFAVVAWVTALVFSWYALRLGHGDYEDRALTVTTVVSAGAVLVCWGTTIPLVFARRRRDRTSE